MATKGVTVRVRVEDAEAKRWKTAARRAKQSLSDWMRLTLSSAATPAANQGHTRRDKQELWRRLEALEAELKECKRGQVTS